MSETSAVVSDVFRVLLEKNLYLLHAVLHISNLYAVQKVLAELKDDYHIDLTSEEAVAKLSDKQIAQLIKYEKKNTEFLVSTIVNEYPETVKYIQNSMDPNRHIDPLGTFQKWFGAFIFVTGMMYLYLVTFCVMPEGNQRFADMITGVIVSQLFQIAFAYIFRHRQESQWNTQQPPATRPKK